MLWNGGMAGSVKAGAHGREGTVLKSDQGAGCAVDEAGRTPLDKWPPSPLFAVASSTHFEKVREPRGRERCSPPPPHFAPNKVCCFTEHIEDC